MRSLHLACVLLALACCAASSACLLDSSGRETPFGPGGAGGGGPGGSSANGGAGGDPGEACPGIPSTIAVYQAVTFNGDTTPASNDLMALGCGADDTTPDIVYAVTAKSKGVLIATLESTPPFTGVMHVRTVCEDAGSETLCDSNKVSVPMEAGQTVHLIVNGRVTGPAGSFKLQLFLDGCGNGTIDGPEECDDGNTQDGDTCSGVCTVLCDDNGTSFDYDEVYLHPATHHCYMLVVYPDAGWAEAESQCVAWGGHLSALATPQEIDDVGGLLSKGMSDTWIGGTDENHEDTFTWTDGEPWSYAPNGSPWGADNPNGGTNANCVEIYLPGELNDESCSVSQEYLCERPPAGTPPP